MMSLTVKPDGGSALEDPDYDKILSTYSSSPTSTDTAVGLTGVPGLGPTRSSPQGDSTKYYTAASTDVNKTATLLYGGPDLPTLHNKSETHLYDEEGSLEVNVSAKQACEFCAALIPR